MAHAHYVVLFGGLIFGKNPAANHRSGVTAANRAIEYRSISASTKVEQSAAKLFGVWLWWLRSSQHWNCGSPIMSRNMRSG
jgi:hypothetical protein